MTELTELVQVISFTFVWSVAAGLFGMLLGFTVRIKMMNPKLSLKACIEVALKTMYELLGK